MTTKKVMIVAHSMGNINTVHNLWKMSWQKKQERIARYIAMAPPFLGAMEAVLGPLSMDRNMSIDLKFKKVGITAEIFKKMMPVYPSLYQLMVSKFTKYHRLEPWMKSVEQRIEEERGRNEISYGSIMDIFPSWEYTCAQGLEQRQKGCFTGLYEMWDLGMIEDLEINPDTVEQLLEYYSFEKHSKDMYKHFNLDSKFHEM
jgi:hypothetical protein